MKLTKKNHKLNRKKAKEFTNKLCDILDMISKMQKKIKEDSMQIKSDNLNNKYNKKGV